MTKATNTINYELLLADNATQSVLRLADAIEKVSILESPLLDDIREIFERDMRKALESADLLENAADHLHTLFAMALLEEKKANGDC